MPKHTIRNPSTTPARGPAHLMVALLAMLLPLGACSDVTEPDPGPLTLLPWLSSGRWPQRVWLGPVGTTIPDSIQVEVNDTTHGVVPGVEMTWTVTAGGGTVSPGTSLTDSAGIARAQWTLGDQVGEQRLRVTAPTGDSAWFDALATPPPPDDWATVLDVALTVDPAGLDATPPDTATAAVTVTNQWTGAVRLTTYNSCLFTAAIYNADGAEVDTFPWGCYSAIWYWLIDPGESVRLEWTAEDLALEPGEYTVRADLHVTRINGDVQELDDPETSLVIR